MPRCRYLVVNVTDKYIDVSVEGKCHQLSYDVKTKTVTRTGLADLAGEPEIQILNDQQTFFDVLQSETERYHCRPNPRESVSL